MATILELVVSGVSGRRVRTESLYYMRKAAVHGMKRALRMRYIPRRYAHILSEIGRLKPRTILEIGTNDGLNAIRLYRAAARHRNDVRYYGFDLFENLDEAALARESAVPVPSFRAVKAHLSTKGSASTCSRATRA